MFNELEIQELVKEYMPPELRDIQNEKVNCITKEVLQQLELVLFTIVRDKVTQLKKAN